MTYPARSGNAPNQAHRSTRPDDLKYWIAVFMNASTSALSQISPVLKSLQDHCLVSWDTWHEEKAYFGEPEGFIVGCAELLASQ
jgi:hypothetical protein